jgi:ABC-type Fe3+/spermidine/putrescine transport system ATPase subunit
VVIYEAGQVRQSAPRGEPLWRPASESVARILGFRNVLRGTALTVTPEQIRLAWRGQVLEALNSATQPYCPAPGSPVAFFIRPEDPRLIRKDAPPPDPAHHTNILAGSVVRDVDLGVTRTLLMRLDQPGSAAQGDYDLEVEIPRFVYDILHLARDRDWRFSLHRSAIHVLPS